MKKNKKNIEKKNFESISEEWWQENGKFSILHKINPLRIKYIISQISKNQKLNKIKIMDVGCGGGLVCEPLSRLGASVTGIDFVKKNILVAKNHAKKENLKINYKCIEIEKLKGNNKFDVILVLEVIEHLNDWKSIIPLIKNLLNKNGVVIFSTINRNIFSKFFALFLAEKILKLIPNNTHTYEQFIKPKELTKELKKNKLKIIDLKGMIYNPFTRNWMLSKDKFKINYFCTAKKIN